MADNIALPAASVTAATDERTIAATTVHVQRVVDQGGTAVANGQVTPTATAATLIAARETRKHVILLNYTNLTVYVGIATVTTANGFPLVPGAAVVIATTALIQNIVASVTGLTGVMAYIEVYDA